MNCFKENLRVLRKGKGLKQEELATILGLKRWNITAYERGVAKPPLNVLLKIANYFQIELNLLLSTTLPNEDLRGTSVNKKKHKLDIDQNSLALKYKELQMFEVKQKQQFNNDVHRIGNSLERILKLLQKLPSLKK